MLERLQSRRLIVLALALVLGFAGLVYRLVDLQVLRQNELHDLATENTQIQTIHEARRGDILDRHGNPLATTIPVKTVVANPVLIGTHQETVARAIAPLLELDPAELSDRLRMRTRADGVPIQWVLVKRKVPLETWEEVKAAMRSLDFGVDEALLAAKERRFLSGLRRRGVYAEEVEDQRRVYPNGQLAAHVLGFVGRPDDPEPTVNGVPVAQITGRGGIELTLNSQLSGVAGWRSTQKDSRGRELVSGRMEDVPARHGMNAVLTLDSVLQLILESELAAGFERHDPLGICGAIVNPKTGEILAMATLPSFDPADPGGVDAGRRRNRMLTDVIEPGSTFKIVVVSGALEDRIVTLGTPFDCEEGAFAYGGRILHDHHPYGRLTVEEIITKSSNIGAAKIGIQLGPERLQQHILDFGFGRRTGVPLPGEVGGIVHDVDDWSKVTIAQIPMGHGIAVTRMQMTMAMCAIANGGLMMRPMLVSRLDNSDGSVAARYQPQRSHQVIRLETARDVVEALKTVPREGGTAPQAALDHYTAAGKTGTAQKAGRGGYMPGKFVSSFIGFLPADDPQLCIGIFFDEPHRNGYYGGVTAAPVFKRVAERAAAYLGLEPDIQDDAAPEGTTRLVRTAAIPGGLR